MAPDDASVPCERMPLPPRLLQLRISTLFNNGPRQASESVLLGHGEAKISAEPAGIPSPSGPDFRDQPLLSPERDLDATGNLDRLLTLPNGNRRRRPRAPVVLHDGFCLLGQLLLLLPCEAVIPAVPSSLPNLDIGNSPLFVVEVYGNAWIAPPPGDCDCMLAGSDGYPIFNGAYLFPISGEIIATSSRISKAGNRACRSMDAPAFSLRGRRPRLLWCWWVGFGRELQGRAPLKGGVGVSPTEGFLLFPQVGAVYYVLY